MAEAQLAPVSQSLLAAPLRAAHAVLHASLGPYEIHLTEARPWRFRCRRARVDASRCFVCGRFVVDGEGHLGCERRWLGEHPEDGSP